MDKITNLTDEQIARFPEFIDKWTKIGLSTQPADRERAERAIRGLYALAKLKEPCVIWLPCPISAALSAVVDARLASDACSVKVQVRDAVGYAVNRAVDDAVGGAVGYAVNRAVGGAVGYAVSRAVDDAVRGAVYGAVRGAVDDATKKQLNGNNLRQMGYAFFGGSLWAGYGAWADYFNTVLSIPIDRNYLELMQSCGFYWTLDGVCFASERPAVIRRDNNGQLHCDNGMSISYPSGWGLYHWHGVAIPGAWVTGQKPSAADALTWKNIEQRRAACEIVGWNNILREANAVTINTDDDPEIGVLLEADIPDSGKERFLRVRCGTGREFVLPVPRNMATALEANAWTYGLDKIDFKPEVRT